MSDLVAMKIISPTDARAQGLKFFFTGKPCKRGHVAERYLNPNGKSGPCRECYKRPEFRAAQAVYSKSPRARTNGRTSVLKYQAKPGIMEKASKRAAKRSLTPEGRAKTLIAEARRSSKKRGHPAPTITWQDLMPALERGTCDVSGLPFDFAPTPKKGRMSPYAPSLDRIDNEKPYTRNNFRVVLWAINAGCNSWGLEIYLKIASAAATLH